MHNPADIRCKERAQADIARDGQVCTRCFPVRAHQSVKELTDPEPPIKPQENNMARSPHWQLIETDSGFRLRLVGANGEKILWSESYTEKRTAQNALDLVASSFGLETKSLNTHVEYLDDRTGTA